MSSRPASLARRAAGGLPREELVALVPPLRAFARSLTRGDVHAADDLVQDTILLALRAEDRFAPGTDLKAWLFRILRNRSHSVARRGRVAAQVTVAVDDLESRAWVPPAQEALVEVRGFKRAFARLAPAQREVLVLAGVHGLAYGRIAEVCGCEVAAVKSRLNRARTALRRMVQGGQDAPVAAAARFAAVPARLAVAADPPLLLPPPPLRLLAPAPPPVQAWLADAERRIGRTEAQVAAHRRVVRRLEAAGVASVQAEAVLGLALRRLATLRAGRERLLVAAA